MANNYTDATGVLMFDGPARITPVIRTLFTSFKLDENADGVDHQRYIAVLSEDNGDDWDQYIEAVAELAGKHLGFSAAESASPADMLRSIGQHFGVDITAVLATIEFDGFVAIHDVVQLALQLPDGHNLIGYCMEGCWYCSKPRLWEFGGWAAFKSKRYQLSLSTADLMAFATTFDAHLDHDKASASKSILVLVQQLIDGVVDSARRAEIKRHLATQLSSSV